MEALFRRPLEQDANASLPDELIGEYAPDWWDESLATPLNDRHALGSDG